MEWPTRPLTHVDITAYDSTLTNGCTSQSSQVCIVPHRQALTQRLRNLFTWQDDVNAEVGEAWQVTLFCDILVAGPDGNQASPVHAPDSIYNFVAMVPR